MINVRLAKTIRMNWLMRETLTGRVQMIAALRVEATMIARHG
jgi:hypothetical protein